MEDLLDGHLSLGLEPEGPAPIQVPVKPGKIAGGDLQPYPMARPENMSRIPEVHLYPIDPPGLQQLLPVGPVAVTQPQDTVANVDSPSIGVNVHQLGRKIRVRRTAGHIEPNLDRPQNLKLFLQRTARVD